MLQLLREPKTVSGLWYDLKLLPHYAARPSSVTYDWFVLSLDLLYLMKAIHLKAGRLYRTAR